MRVEEATARWPTQHPYRVPPGDDRKLVVAERECCPAYGEESREDLPKHQRFPGVDSGGFG